MGTFLVNAKMNPALAARVEASVTGKKARAATLRPRLVMLARVGLALVVAAVIASVLRVRQRERDELSRARSEVVSALERHADAVTAEELRAARTIESLLVTTTRTFDGDVVRRGLALDQELRRPLVYVRGPAGNFASPDGIVAAAAVSSRDELVACLLDPPASRAEKDVAAKAHVEEALVSHVRRLHEAEVGLPFLAPELRRRMASEVDLAVIAKMRRDLERAPIDNAKKAACAPYVLAVLDEPGEGTTELDGERRHHVRVLLVDVASKERLLDVRRLVDPSWISVAKRPMRARAYDSCLLALDVRAAAAR